MTIRVDIVGGGISGLSTAISLKEHNQSLKVVVHEKYKKIGYNHEGRRCGEAHSIEKEWDKWRPDRESIFNNITRAEIVIGERKRVFHRDPGTAFILNRQEFIHQLGELAKQQGVIILTGDRITNVHDLEGDYIVDASGCPSVVKRVLNIGGGIKGITYQQTLENANCFRSDTIRIFYTGYFGYYRVFPRDPRKKEVNVGIGFSGTFNYNLKEMLERFKEHHNNRRRCNVCLWRVNTFRYPKAASIQTYFIRRRCQERSHLLDKGSTERFSVGISREDVSQMDILTNILV
jgi:flavin-dependent dehydrogenase